MDQTDGKTEKIGNAMIGSQEQDIDISTVSATYGGEPVSKSKSKRKKKIGTCTGPISNRNHKTYRRNTDNNTAVISSTNFQPNVALIYYSKNPPKFLKPIIKKEQSKVSRVFNAEIDVALTDEDEKSVSVNVGVVSKTKPQRVVPLIYNTETIMMERRAIVRRHLTQISKVYGWKTRAEWTSVLNRLITQIAEN